MPAIFQSSELVLAQRRARTAAGITLCFLVGLAITLSAGSVRAASTTVPTAASKGFPTVELCEGQTHEFCATLEDDVPISISWTKDGSPIPGATEACYTATAGPSGTSAEYCVTLTYFCGPPDTRCFTLASKPSPSSSPLGSATACAGETHTFCTTSGPFTYSWTKNGSTITGATHSCYTATAGSEGTVDAYCVTATGSCGSGTSCGTLTAGGNVTATDPQDATACTGLTHSFCTTAGGSGPFSYSWTKNGSNISGSTDSCYTATAGSGGTIDTYCVTVSGACGTPVTRCATLTATTNVTATPLSDAAKCEATTNQFCTTAGGSGPFSYSWTKNGSNISGSTDSCYTATAGSGGTIDTYCVTVSGACGTPVTRCATLTTRSNVTATALADTIACAGTQLTFCTTASGSGPFTYSWTKNGSNIGGATDSCYTATAGSGGTVDTYCVTVSGACGTPVSRCATLTATTNVTATALSDATRCVGLTNQFCTTAGGSGPFTYNWTMNGSSIGGATDNCYTATAGTGGTVDTYCVTVAGSCGNPVDRCATLTATTNVTATPLQDATGCPGDTNAFCTTAGGSGPFTYSWTKNGSSIPGATDSCYTATAGATGAVDTYCVTVSGGCGTPVQRCATFTANDCGIGVCHLTQGAYGNENGQFNGMDRLTLIDLLLNGGMTVGKLGIRSLTFADGVHDSQCIIDRLPASGTSAALPNFGDETLDSDCQTSPTPILLQSGRWRNNLLGQVVSLSLNIRLASGVTSPSGCTTEDTNIENQVLCATMVTRRSLPGPDGCRGTADDVHDLLGPDGNPLTPDNLQTLVIPPAVLASLTALGLPQTVGGLLELGNRALAGMSTGTASLGDVNTAVEGINMLFDECRELMSCTP